MEGNRFYLSKPEKSTYLASCRAMALGQERTEPGSVWLYSPWGALAWDCVFCTCETSVQQPCWTSAPLKGDHKCVPFQWHLSEYKWKTTTKSKPKRDTNLNFVNPAANLPLVAMVKSHWKILMFWWECFNSSAQNGIIVFPYHPSFPIYIFTGIANRCNCSFYQY